MENLSDGTLDFPEKTELLQKAKIIHPLIEKLRDDHRSCENIVGFFKTSDEFPLFYRCWCRDSVENPEKIILCIHGLHSHGEKFVLLADKLIEQENWLIFAIDLRGHGLSWKTVENKGDIPDYEIWIRDIAEFIKMLQGKFGFVSLHIVAESMGAALAIHLAKNLETDVDDLVLLSPAVKPWKYSEFSMIMEAFAFALLSSPDRARVPNFGRSKLTSNCAEYMEYQLVDPLRMAKLSPRYYYQVVKMIHQLRLWRYDHDFVPTCAFYGEKDHLVKFDGVVKFISYIKQEDKALYYVPRAFHDLLTDHAAWKYNLFEKIRHWIREH
ncbi:MAG TPA: alpha/beta fold hydrolase [Candidatus Lokiarchaeia archaeon]|nr:alpha/beta fold hydrolase [Candidatus Lokiarchaeia archaeon]